ncbi:MAG: TonB-dependent receptor [Chitinophagaceae bacterium]|nr:TonB-dependent receptor [Chitinophagaceae bacterium]
MRIIFNSLAAFIFLTGSVKAQQGLDNDTLVSKESYAKDVTVIGQYSRADIHQLPEVVGTSIMAGKKNSLIVMDNVNGNVVTNTMRQVMAKVPGIHVWESEGSGIQIGVAARGLSPNRSWEFNTRQNGYDIAADPFGYPEAYYTPQLQAVQRIQVVRGAGSLQYGPQFGGMINFVMRDGSDIRKNFQFETQNTVGSYGLINTYNAVGGETEKVHYYAFYDHRNADGWRENSRYKTGTGFATATWKVNKRLRIGAEVTSWHANSQQPGGLTDAQFAQNDKQSLRSRNWFDLKWNIGTLKASYDFAENKRLQATLFGFAGDRSSIGFMLPPNVKDTINAATLDYNNRTVFVDEYRNMGAELRYLSDYNLFNTRSTFSGGLRYYKGRTNRYNNGKGDTGSDFNTDIIGEYPQQLLFTTTNWAAFAENIFRIGEHFKIIPGLRVEQIGNEVSGQINMVNNTPVKASEQSRSRSFLLAGVGAEYHIGKTEIYANWSQAYRPVLFSDLTANGTTDIIDPNLEDAKGYNFDLGYRGNIKDYLFFDAGIFFLQYDNRIGLIAQQNPDGSFYNYRTNVGNSQSKGVEALMEFNPVKAFSNNLKYGSFSVFASVGYTDARYDDFTLTTRVGNELRAVNYKDKKVENAPEWIIRYGVNYFYKGLTATVQWSYVDEAFSDANNTVTPTANGLNGLIPSYHIGDISVNYKFLERYNVRAGLNNITDESYFTRRAGGYPGPGLMPADGRNFYVSLGLKL